jgi:hypothetical protein
MWVANYIKLPNSMVKYAQYRSILIFDRHKHWFFILTELWQHPGRRFCCLSLKSSGRSPRNAYLVHP